MKKRTNPPSSAACPVSNRTLRRERGDIRGLVDALCRDGSSEISRDLSTKRLQTRREWPQSLKTQANITHIYLLIFSKVSYLPLTLVYIGWCSGELTATWCGKRHVFVHACVRACLCVCICVCCVCVCGYITWQEKRRRQLMLKTEPWTSEELRNQFVEKCLHTVEQITVVITVW